MTHGRGGVGLGLDVAIIIFSAAIAIAKDVPAIANDGIIEGRIRAGFDANGSPIPFGGTGRGSISVRVPTILVVFHRCKDDAITCHALGIQRAIDCEFLTPARKLDHCTRLRCKDDARLDCPRVNEVHNT